MTRTRQMNDYTAPVKFMIKGLKMRTRLPVTKPLEIDIHTNHIGVLILCGQFVV